MSGYRAGAPAFSGRKGGERQTEASVTVFLALTFLMIAALLLTIEESARMVSQRLYLQVGVDSAMESLFSQYHRPLWDKYRIFALEYLDEEQLAAEMKDFLKPYMENHDLFPFSAEDVDDGIRFSNFSYLCEDTSFEEEILEYMKYGLIESLLHFSGDTWNEASLSGELETVFTRAKESSEIRELQERYRLDAHDLDRVEAAIDRIAGAVESIRAEHYDAGRTLEDEDDSGFYRASGRFQDRIGELDRAVENYRTAADRLAEKVRELRSDFAGRAAELSTEGRAAIDAEIREYENYVTERGSIRAEIEAMPDRGEELCAKAVLMEQRVTDFEDEIAAMIEEYEEEMEEEDDEGDEDDGDDEDLFAMIEEMRADFYREAKADWDGFPLIRFDGKTSTINRQNQRILEHVAEFLERDFLSFVLPDGAGAPSRDEIYPLSPGLSPDSEADPVRLAVIGEYILKFFHYYHGAEDGKQFLPRSGSTALEVEYLLNGGRSDYENLTEFVLELAAFREAMNLIYLYTDTEKRNEARLFVTSFLCILGNPALISVFTFFVLGIWALGQAVQDVKRLLSGGRVPVFHTDESWELSLTGLMELGQKQKVPLSEEQGRGLSYRDYLRAFLYGAGLFSQEEINARMLCRMEENLRFGSKKGDPSFEIRQCLYGAQVTVEFGAQHLMFRTGAVQSVSGGSPGILYRISADSYYSYRNEIQ